MARALRVIGEHRKQYSLQLFATTVESGDTSSAFPVADAYKRLQIADHNMRDESVISYYQTLCAHAPPGSKASYAEALRTIATARDSALLRGHLDDPNAPIVIEKGSEDQPVGLDNIGNTCYLNSLLQYYYTVKPVRDVVMNFREYRMELNTENMLKKRVGGRAVSRGEIIKAQKCKFNAERKWWARAYPDSRRRTTKPVHKSEDRTYKICQANSRSCRVDLIQRCN